MVEWRVAGSSKTDQGLAVLLGRKGHVTQNPVSPLFVPFLKSSPDSLD